MNKYFNFFAFSFAVLLSMAGITFIHFDTDAKNAFNQNVDVFLKDDYMILVEHFSGRDTEVVKKTLETHDHVRVQGTEVENKYYLYGGVRCYLAPNTALSKEKIVNLTCYKSVDGSYYSIHVAREYVPTTVTTLDGIYYYYDSLPEVIQATVNRLKKMLRGEEQNRDAAMPCSNYTPG